MALNVGIVGLPNVGKSTIFNALTNAQNAEAANYPFCTIEPNRAIVPLADSRLETLAEIMHSKKIIPSTVEFVDIAGLVAGASRGEGLGNKFLGNIREAAAILHVVRCFDDPDVIHVDGSVNPVRDIEIIETELVMADLQTLSAWIERAAKKARADKDMKAAVDEAENLRKHLETGALAAAYPESDNETIRQIFAGLNLLTAKNVIYACNVDEAALADGNAYVEAVQKHAEASSLSREVLMICAKVEEELAGMTEDEKREFMSSFGAEDSGLAQVVRKAYHLLGMISYFTVGPQETRAWTITSGWKAPQAASVIHTDFERGFIRAEVIAYDAYVEHNGEAGAKAAGVMRVEGKEYVVADGDVMHFRTNV